MENLNDILANPTELKEEETPAHVKGKARRHCEITRNFEEGKLHYKN